MRHDALAGAAKIVLEMQRLGRQTGGMATVSLFKSQPQNFCNIPSAVDFSFSMQHPDKATLDGMKKHIEEFIHKVAADDGLKVAELDCIYSYDPNSFDADAVACVEASAKEQGFNYKKLISHTGMTREHVESKQVANECSSRLALHEHACPDSHGVHSLP